MKFSATTHRFLLLHISAFCCLFGALQAVASEAGRSAVAIFNAEIHPLLEQRCFKCHSHTSTKIKGGLVLDTVSGLLVGGDSGPGIVPGKPDESILLTAVTHTDPDLKMPPKGEALTTREIDMVRRWIKDGLDWPTMTTSDADEDLFSKEDRTWWAIQPIGRPAPPEIANDEWSQNAVDKFVLKRMLDAGLEPAPKADRATLIRRMYFDLTGLPPSERAVAQFVNDTSPDAVDHLIERILLSPRYGERWAQHWLDLVRYADSDGYRADHYRPDIWRYRDYVIRAFNDDKPYDRFVAEQIAGDEIAPNDPDAITATGFLRLWIYEYNNRDVEGQWRTILDDITATTSDVFLGVGLQCARCHDHKFDPLLQKDYFRLQAYFAPLFPRDDIPAATATEFLRHRSEIEAWEKDTAGLRGQIDDVMKPYMDRAGGVVFSKFTDELQGLLNKPATHRTPYEHQIAELTHRQVLSQEGTPSESSIKAEDKEKLKALRNQLATFDHLKPPDLPAVMSATDVGPFAPPTRIPKKAQLGDIEPGVLSIINPEPAAIHQLPSAPNSTGRRAELARWLASPGNPLTRRVIVNRVWQYHLGKGLSENASDFGTLGRPPTHPELLDWLATRFVEQGWSIKRLHKLIVSSATYQQSSTHPGHATAFTVDPGNELLWHAEIRRLDAEQIRDAMLVAGRQMDYAMGGPAVDHSSPRRSIYTRVRRNSRDPLLDVFDFPERLASASDRPVTTTPTQSLKMINGEFTRNCAEAMAAHLREAGQVENADAIDAAYQLVLGRKPRAAERQAAADFLIHQEVLVRGRDEAPQRTPFVAETMPYREGPAARLKPGSGQTRFDASMGGPISLHEFTIEAYVLLKSIYQDGSVRTIAAQWDGDKTSPGWSFGVTGAKSQFAPQRLVLQLTTASGEGTPNHQPVFAGLDLKLNTPYYVAATVSFNDDAGGTVTFFAKNIAEPDSPLQRETANHGVPGPLRCDGPVTIGGRNDQDGHFFDGLIDDVRYSDVALPKEQLLLIAETAGEHTLGFWQFASEQTFQLDRSSHRHDLTIEYQKPNPVVPEQAALEDLGHVLLNSNEFLYVD